MGTPVLAANTPSYREVCGDAALLFDVDDTEHLAELLRRLLADSQLAASYVRRGKRLVASMDSSTGAAHIMAALENVVLGGGNPPINRAKNALVQRYSSMSRST